MISPISTVSPSKTFNIRHFGMRVSLDSPSAPVIINLLLPLVSFPKLIVPEDSARIACSFGTLASNKSATLGKPPVMSLVFDDS